MHDGRRFATTASSSAAAESVQTLVEAIVELRPSSSFQPFHNSHSACGGGVGGSHNFALQTPGSPPTSNIGDGTTSFLGLPARTQSTSSVGASSYVDLMTASSLISPSPGSSFAGAGSGEGGNMTSAPSVSTNRGGESPHSSAALTRGSPSIPAPTVGVAHGGAFSASLRQSGTVSMNAGAISSSSFTSTPPMNSATNAAAGAGSGCGAAGGGAAGAGGPCPLMHPSGGWICRAMAFNEKEVSHANGAISVNQSLTSKCPLINEVAKGKIMARILSSYQEVQERYGLSHVELTVDNQYLSRSDMFLISEVLRERILYEGEEMHVCSFRIRVREMLQAVVTSPSRAASSTGLPTVPSALSASFPGVSASSAAAAPTGVASSGGTTSTAVPGVGAPENGINIGAGAGAVGAGGLAGSAVASAAGAVAYIRVGSGIVLPTTRINFQSLSPIHYILLELSHEMWETTMDGRIALTLAIRKFLSELLLKQLPKRKASPHICVVFTGRLKREFQYGRLRDVFHLLDLPRDLRSNVDIVEEIRMHCEALVDRVLREVQGSAYRQLETEVRAYREAATASHSRASGSKSPRCWPANDGDDLNVVTHSLQEREMSGITSMTSTTNLFPATGETLKRARTSAAFSAAAAATEATFDSYVRARQQCIDDITAKRLFVHAKQSNTLEALSILLERCTHNYIDRNLTLCGHAVTVVSAGKGFYQVTNNLVQVVCARLHDIGLEKVHVVCVGRPPLHVTPLLEYTSNDETLRSQYHLHSCALPGAGAGAGVRGMAGRVPTPLHSGEAERYYETPEWMSVFFFHASLQYKSGGETVFELLPKECWQREYSVMAALKTLRPAQPQPQQQACQQQSQSYAASAMLPGGVTGDGGVEDGNASVGAGATSGVQERDRVAAAAATMSSCGSHGTTTGEASLPGVHLPLLIPGLGLRTYPVPEVTLPVHPSSASSLLCADRWGVAASGPPYTAAPSRAAAGVAVAAGGLRSAFSQPLVPLHLQSCAADPLSVSWTGSIGAEHAPSPMSPLGTSSGKAAAAGSWLGAAAPVSTSSKCSSPLLVRATTTNSSLFASLTAPSQGLMPRGVTGTVTLAAQATTRQQTQLQQGALPMLTSNALPHTAACGPLLQQARYVPPRHTFSSMPFTAAGAHSGGILGSEAALAATTGAWPSAQQRRSRTGVTTALGADPHTMAVAPSAFGGGRLSYPGNLPSSYATGCKPTLHISRSFDHKTTANPEYHSLGAFEDSVRSVSSSALVPYNSAPRLQTRSLLWREGSTSKSSVNSIATSVAAVATSAGTDLGVSGNSTGGGLRSVQLRLEDGHMYRDVMGMVVSFASCAWYCLHASKPHQDSGGGSTTVVVAAGTVAANVPVGHTMVARQGDSGGAAAAIVVAGGSSPSTSAAIGRGLLQQRDGQPSTRVESATSTAAESCYSDASMRPLVKRWHKASSSTRSDAVFCGCNVVDSDLRNGYLILEITINAAVLPQSFWSPRLLLDDNYWAHLMSCFTGRDDRLTLDEELEFASEDDADDDTFTASGSSTDKQVLLLSTSGGRRWKEGDDAANVRSSAAAVMAMSAGRETGGSTRGGPESGRAIDDYHFQSDFRPAEVFCHSHSGITPDGRTLIIPTHSNNVYFKSPEEIFLRFTPQLFVSTVDEVGGVALEPVGPKTLTSPHPNHTAAADDEVAERGPTEVCASYGVLHYEGREARSSVAAAVSPTGRPGAFERLEEEEEGSNAPYMIRSGAAAKATATTGPVDGEGQAWAPPHPPEAGAMRVTSKNDRSSSTDSGAGSRAKAAEDTAMAASPQLPKSACALSSLNASAEAMESTTDGPSQRTAVQPGPATVDAALSTESLPPPKDGTVCAAKPESPTSRPRPLRLRPTRITTSSPVLATGTPPPPSLRVHTLPLAAVSRQESSSLAGLPSPSLTPTTATHSGGRHPAHGPFHQDEVPLMPGTTVTVGFVQLRNSLLFAIKPINPLRYGSEEEHREDATALSQSAESVSTATVLRRRWQWKHPDIASEPQHLASWTRLCTCRLLPLYGSKPAYPRESFYTVSPHQYTVTSPSSNHADPAEENRRLLEFVLQRLQQQYQIVADSPGLVAGSQWPRAEPSPNARLEMSLGHQTHTLKLGETAKTISVTRMLHRGMYSNGQVTHMLSYRYLLWNYLADEFTTREVHMEAQVGERNAFRWESLDGWLQERPKAFIPRGPDIWLRSREVAIVLLPEDAAHPPSYEEFCRFISYRFSVHLSTHGKVVWKSHEGGVSLDISEATPLTFPATPPLMEVALVHDNPLTLDTRNIVDRVTGRTIGFEVPVQKRLMSVDISLPQEYSSHCCYYLKVSWLACAASVITDWFGSFIANAARFRFHAVPLGCYYMSPKAESLTSHYDVEAASPEEELALRCALMRLLMTPTYHYYPDTPVLTRNCRLVHFSGLCCVIVPPSATTVAQWYQNSFVRQGSVEQLVLLGQFKEAVATARQRVADRAAGSASAAVAHPTTEDV
ncbi:Vacuolar membrane-associated protein Iml1, putative [Leishmania lindenbergi]|uniref:Vacuolar membrane-associated protein Iml1 n=1 Tax=Leishmania lindenbergi TaxID=651832 RepID=A0AAW3AVH1_9TRYP